MNTRNFGIALVAGLSFAVLSIASVNAETIEVVATPATGCVATYVDLNTADDSPYSAVTLSCPSHPVQVAAVAHT